MKNLVIIPLISAFFLMLSFSGCEIHDDNKTPIVDTTNHFIIDGKRTEIALCLTDIEFVDSSKVGVNFYFLDTAFQVPNIRRNANLMTLTLCVSNPLQIPIGIYAFNQAKTLGTLYGGTSRIDRVEITNNNVNILSILPIIGGETTLVSINDSICEFKFNVMAAGQKNVVGYYKGRMLHDDY